MKRVILFGIFVFLMAGVLAVEGVVPRTYLVEYNDGVSEEVSLNFVLDGKGVLDVNGELAEYVSLEKEEIWDTESVLVSVDLPSGLDLVGIHSAEVSAGGAVSSIRVDFGYPDNYVDLDLAVASVNVGEETEVNLNVVNKGEVGFNVEPVVDIYFEEDLVESFYGEIKWLEDEVSYSFPIDGESYLAGKYLAVARVGGFVGEDSFGMGEKKLKILNYTRNVREDKVEEFWVEVESLWDDKMSEVYAEVRFGNGQGFDTSIVSLEGWDKKKLFGYIDGGGLLGSEPITIRVYYDGEVEEKLGSVVVLEKPALWPWFLLFIILSFLFFIAYRFWKIK